MLNLPFIQELDIYIQQSQQIMKHFDDKYLQGEDVVPYESIFSAFSTTEWSRFFRDLVRAFSLLKNHEHFRGQLSHFIDQYDRRIKRIGTPGINPNHRALQAQYFDAMMELEGKRNEIDSFRGFFLDLMQRFWMANQLKAGHRGFITDRDAHVTQTKETIGKVLDKGGKLDVCFTRWLDNSVVDHPDLFDTLVEKTLGEWSAFNPLRKEAMGGTGRQ